LGLSQSSEYLLKPGSLLRPVDMSQNPAIRSSCNDHHHKIIRSLFVMDLLSSARYQQRNINCSRPNVVRYHYLLVVVVGTSLWVHLLLANTAMNVWQNTKDGQQQQTTLVDRSPIHQTNGPINFGVFPQLAAQELVECFVDSDCSIYYFHTHKTGGTDVEKRFFQLFPPSLPNYSFRKPLKEVFENDVDKYCSAKFSSYQVQVDDDLFLNTILPTCMDYNYQTMKTKTNEIRSSMHDDDGGGGGPRAIVLATFREPIARTISSVHQVCNKNLQRRDNVTATACRRCSYSSDQEFWDAQFFERATYIYKSIQNVIFSNSANTTVVMVDTMDLDDFYAAINQVAITRKYTSFLINVKPKKGQSHHFNSEIIQRCNFAVTSEMIRKLQIPQMIYRNLTSTGIGTLPK
jgi:hypothetical protein